MSAANLAGAIERNRYRVALQRIADKALDYARPMLSAANPEEFDAIGDRLHRVFDALAILRRAAGIDR